MTLKQPSFKFLPFLGLLFLTIKLTSVTLVYKIIVIGNCAVSAAALIIPFWFMLGDIIAEVYGYKIAKQVIGMTLICQFIFACSCASFTHVESITSLLYPLPNASSLNSLPRVSLASVCAIYCGGLLNAYAIVKSKMLLKGQYFWLRSLGASAIGEIVFTVVAYVMEFLGVISLVDLGQLILMSCMIKVFCNPVLATAGHFIVFLLKELEGINHEEENKTHYPFTLPLEHYTP